jgi:hypothetical protein
MWNQCALHTGHRLAKVIVGATNRNPNLLFNRSFDMGINQDDLEGYADEEATNDPENKH